MLLLNNRVNVTIKINKYDKDIYDNNNKDNDKCRDQAS